MSDFLYRTAPTTSGYWNVSTPTGVVSGVWATSRENAMSKVPGATWAESVL